MTEMVEIERNPSLPYDLASLWFFLKNDITVFYVSIFKKIGEKITEYWLNEGIKRAVNCIFIIFEGIILVFQFMWYFLQQLFLHTVNFSTSPLMWTFYTWFPFTCSYFMQFFPFLFPSLQLPFLKNNSLTRQCINN